MRINLGNTPLFRGMTVPDIEEMLCCLRAAERTYKKGAVILPEGMPTEQLGVVLSGRVIIEMGDVWGNNSVLSSVGAGGIFAEAYACAPGEPLMVNVTAAEDTEVLLTLCSEKNLQLSRRVLHTSPKSIRKRLLSYFSECIKRTGSYEFDIPYNRQQLADYLNVERSALSNELSLMQRDGLIRYEKNHFAVTEQLGQR